MIASLSLLALNLALTVNSYISWRFSNSYIGTMAILAILTLILWFVGFVWDRKLKLWKEQNVVSIERNPYSTIHMTPKEILSFNTIYIPWLKEHNPKSAEMWQKIVDLNMNTSENLRKSVEEIERLYG
jgi:hypothetical protein